MRVFLAVVLAMLFAVSAYAQPAKPAFTQGVLNPGDSISMGSQGALVGGPGQSVFHGTGDWQYVLNSATGTGTDNHAKLLAAFTACNQDGTTDLYIPPGDYYNSANIQFGTCDTHITMAAGAAIVCPPTVTCFTYYSGNPVQMPIAGIIEGFTSTLAAGFAPSTAGSGCEVGDILTLRADVNSYARTARHRFLAQVATCSGAAVATMNVLYPGEYLQNPGNGSAQIMQTVSGTTAGVIVNNMTWSTPPQLAVGVMATELVMPGTNAVTEGNSCVVLDAGPTLCIGDAIKLISKQQAPWDYSTTMQQVHVVNDAGDWTYGPIVAAGGTGYTVGDVLTLQTLTSPVAKGALGFGVQTQATTPATVTVTSIAGGGGTGPITGISITTTGTYDHINYRPIPLTGGTGTGAQAFFTYNTTSPFVTVTYADEATVAQVIDATHILLNKRTLFPHAFDAVNPPILIKLPKVKLITDNLTCQASGQIHNAAYSNRVPSCLDVLGATYPKVDVRCIGEWSICVEEFSTWMGDFTVTCEDAVDMPTQSGTGYCVESIGGSDGSRFKILANDVRHAIGSGTYVGRVFADIANFWWQLGGSQNGFSYDSVVSNAHVGGYNTHDDSYNWTFSNDIAYPGLADPHSTSGVLSQAFDFRGYNNTILNPVSRGNMWCFGDSSQRPDFSGVFPTSSISYIHGGVCDASAFMVAGNTAIGYKTTGDGTGGTPSNTHNSDALTIVDNVNFSNLTQVMNIDTGTNRVVFDGNHVTNYSQLCSCTGPVDIGVSNNVFDNTASYGHVTFTTGSANIAKNAATSQTGTAEYIITNNTFKQSRAPVVGLFYPTQFFKNQSTNALDTAFLNLGGNQVVGNGFSLANSTAGAPIVYVSTDYDPFMGKAVKKLSVIGVPMASTGDAVIIPVPPSITQYTVTGASVGNCSATVAAGLAGLWSGAGKTGLNWAANQALTGATNAITFQSLTMTATALINVTPTSTSPNIYFNIGTGVASPTCNVFVYLQDMSIK